MIFTYNFILFFIIQDFLFKALLSKHYFCNCSVFVYHIIDTYIYNCETLKVPINERLMGLCLTLFNSCQDYPSVRLNILWTVSILLLKH